MTPYLARIDLFPLKSLDGVTVPEVAILDSGALQGDRTYALVDDQGQFINAKRTAAIQRIRASYSEDLATITCMAAHLNPATFGLPGEVASLAQWFSQALQQAVTVQANREAGFPDDTVASGPTIISTATLETVARWYPGFTIEEVRRRFRSNLEIGGVSPFWEDRLFSASGDPVPFTVGDVVLEGINPCQRCPVPTRDSLTGKATPNFQRRFIDQRRTTLHPGVAANRFNHFYRLAVNTVIPGQGGKRLRVGDAVGVEG